MAQKITPVSVDLNFWSSNPLEIEQQEVIGNKYTNIFTKKTIILTVKLSHRITYLTFCQNVNMSSIGNNSLTSEGKPVEDQCNNNKEGLAWRLDIINYYMGLD